jgi:hypothetical protein
VKKNFRSFATAKKGKPAGFGLREKNLKKSLRGKKKFS